MRGGDGDSSVPEFGHIFSEKKKLLKLCAARWPLRKIESENWKPKVTKRGNTFFAYKWPQEIVCNRSDTSRESDGYYSHVYEESSIRLEVMRFPLLLLVWVFLFRYPQGTTNGIFPRSLSWASQYVVFSASYSLNWLDFFKQNYCCSKKKEKKKSSFFPVETICRYFSLTACTDQKWDENENAEGLGNFEQSSGQECAW